MGDFIEQLQERLQLARVEEAEVKERLRVLRGLIESYEKALLAEGAHTELNYPPTQNKTDLLLSVMSPDEPLSPSEIYALLIESDPDFPSDYVYSVLSRLKRQGRVIENDGKYSLPQNKEGMPVPIRS